MSLPKRNENNKIIAGVCAGLAKEFKIEPVVLRVAFVLAFLLWGIGPIVYLILWLLMSTSGENNHE